MSARGLWRPGLPREVSAIKLSALTLTLWLYAVGYALIPRGVWEASIIEQALPAAAWGIMLGLAAVMVTAGMLLARHTPIIAGAVTAMATHGGLAAGLVHSMIIDEVTLGGWLHLSGILCLAVLWGSMAWGTWVMSTVHKLEGEADDGAD